jgi:serine/threonine protein kinase
VALVDRNTRLFSLLISFDEITLQSQIGSGEYGIVYKAIFREELVACKMLSLETANRVNQEEFLQEAQTMSEIAQHPNVIQLIGLCRGERLCILSGE